MDDDERAFDKHWRKCVSEGNWDLFKYEISFASGYCHLVLQNIGGQRLTAPQVDDLVRNALADERFFATCVDASQLLAAVRLFSLGTPVPADDRADLHGLLFAVLTASAVGSMMLPKNRTTGFRYLFEREVRREMTQRLLGV